MLIIFSVFAAIIPMITYLFVIWKFDRYDREPIGLVLINYFWGAIGAIILVLVLNGMIHFFILNFFFDKDTLDFWGSIISAPIIEEIIKGFFLLIMVQNKKFDNITDGIVYGGAIGLGFGMTENLLYFISNCNSPTSWIYVVIIRTLFSAVMHCIATATFGAFLGFAKFKKRFMKILFAIVGLLIAMIIHSAWNSFVSFESTVMLGLIFMTITILIFILVFTLSISSERKIIFSELFEETQNDLIPAKHLGILNTSQRNQPGWVDESIRKIYISSAIRLAFKKIQLRNSSGINKIYYKTEIDNLRKAIAILLGKS